MEAGKCGSWVVWSRMMLKGGSIFLGRLYVFREVCFLLVGVIAAPVGELDRVPRRICFFWFGKPIAGLGDSLVVPPGIWMVVYPRCLN
jgi:hypothetical protein